MATEMDAPGLFTKLESNHSETANEVKNIIHETLSKNPKDVWLVYGLVEYYFNTNSLRCFEILTELREPHDKHLFDKLSEGIKNSPTRVVALMLFGKVICRHPSWLYKVANHSLMTTLLKILKSDNEVVVLLVGLLNLINLLPIIPAAVSPNLNTIFEIFSRLAAWNTTKAANIPETSILQFQVGVYSLFHRLYGMYPCNFLSYLRSHYGNKENLEIFAKTIRPMLDRVRMHPLLVTASKDAELSTNRWRQMETHAVVMECAKVSLDIIEGISNELVAYQFMLGSESAADNTSSTLTGACSYISSERQGYFQATKSETASVWSSFKDDSLSDTLEVKDVNAATSSYLVSPRASAAKIELVSSLSDSQPSSPLRMIGSPLKFAALSDDIGGKKEIPKLSAARALFFLESSTEEKSSSGKFFHTKSNDSDSDVDKEVSELIGRAKQSSSILEDSGKEEERNLRLSQRSDSVIHDEAEGIQTDYEDCTDPAINVVDIVSTASRMRYFSQCGQPPEISELKPKVIIHRSQSCPNLQESLKQTQSSKIDKRHEKSRNLSQQQSSVAKANAKVVSGAGQVSCAVEKSDQTASLTVNELILRALPMMAPTCCFKCKHCLEQGAVVKEMSPAEILDKHIYYGSEVHLKEVTVLANRTTSSPIDEASITKSQIMLLYNQLLFERHRRGLHAERNRCLLAKLKKAQVTDDQQAVLKEQLKRKEMECQDMKYQNLTNLKIVELVEKIQNVEALTTENRAVKTGIENLKSSNEKLKKMLESSEQQSEKRLKELQSCQAKLNAVTMELQESKVKLEEKEKVQMELERVRNEHLLLGELQQKYRDKFSALSSQSGRKPETSHLLQSYRTDLNTMKQQLEQRMQHNEFLKARLIELESQLSTKESVINDQKNSFHKVKEENEENVKILEERNNETVRDVRSLVVYIRQLTSHLSIENSELLRQMPNVLQSLSLQSFPSHLESSTAGASSEVLSTSRRSSGGSDVMDQGAAEGARKY